MNYRKNEMIVNSVEIVLPKRRDFLFYTNSMN